MNILKKNLHRIGIALLLGFVATAAALYFDTPARAQKIKAPETNATKYVCPMHPEVISSKPGNCPKCGMNLVPASEIKASSGHSGCAMDGAAGSSCCSSRKSSPELTLPPGHPPVAGYTVQGECPHSGTAKTNSSQAKP